MYKVVLFISLVIVALLGLSSFVYTFFRVRGMKKVLLSTSTVGLDPGKNRIRKERGSISFSEYKKLKPLLKETQIDFLLNTIFSMRYKKLIFYVKNDFYPIFEINKWLKIRVRVISENIATEKLVRAENVFHKTLKEICVNTKDPEYEFIYVEGAKGKELIKILSDLKPSRRPFFAFVTDSRERTREIKKLLLSRGKKFTSLPGSTRGARFFFGFG